jgi:hypothetical protein
VDTTLFSKSLVIQNPFVIKSRFRFGGASSAARSGRQKPARRGPAGSGDYWRGAAKIGLFEDGVGVLDGKLICPIYPR